MRFSSARARKAANKGPVLLIRRQLFLFEGASNAFFKAIFVGYFAVEYCRNIFAMMMSSGSNKFLSYFDGSTMAMITIALLLIAVNNLKGGNEE